MTPEEEELYKKLVYLENELDDARKNIIGLNEALSIQIEFKGEETEKVIYLSQTLKKYLTEDVINLKKFAETRKEIEKCESEIKTYDTLITTANKQLNEEKSKLTKNEKMVQEIKSKFIPNKKSKVLLFKKND